MKRKILGALLALFISSVSFGQYYGTVFYDLNATAAPYVTIDGVESANTITYDGLGVTITDDGNTLALNQGSSSNAITQNGGHGAILSNGNTITMKVSNYANISFSVCKYSKTGSTFIVTDAGGNTLETLRAESSGTGIDGEVISYNYSGSAQTLTFTVNSTGSVYLHSMAIQNVTGDPIYGITDYSLENAVIPANNKAIAVGVNDGNALSLSKGASTNLITQNGSHGAIMSNGNIIFMRVRKKANISFSLCQYSATGATFSITNLAGTSLGSIRAESKTTGIDEEVVTYNFKGAEEIQTLIFTLNASGSVYLHAIAIENIESLPSLEGKIQAWDFGAEQFGGDTLNMLTNDSINAWYADMTLTADSTGMNLPESFTTGDLTWVGKANADRLRTINTDLIRYDTRTVGDYTGYLYANGTVTVTDGIPSLRYFSIELEEQDEISVVDMGNNGEAWVTFVYADDPNVQNEYKVAEQSVPTEVNFIAKEAGTYLIFDAKDKGSFFRITRKNADYVTVSGMVDESDVTLDISGYGIVFTNRETGFDWIAEVSNGTYSIDIPKGHTYDISLSGANGVVISSATTSIELTEATTVDITLEQVELYTVSGAITGLGSNINNLSLIYTPDAALNKIFVPEPIIDLANGTYSVQLEPACKYTITAFGVNDYYLIKDTIIISADSNTDIEFALKSLYEVALSADGLTNAQFADLYVTFSNLYEEGYEYSFKTVSTNLLRDGTYGISCSGIDAYPVQMKLTSNLIVDGANTSKTLAFEPVHVWSFADKVIASSDTAYNGLLMSRSLIKFQSIEY